MRVYPHKHPAYTKIYHAKAGELLELFDEHLQHCGYFILVDGVTDATVQLLDISTGKLSFASRSHRCLIRKDAAIVLNFIENA